MKKIIAFIISAVLLSSLFCLPTYAKTNEERSYDYNPNYGPYKSYDGKYEFAFASDMDDIIYHNKGTAKLCFFRGNDTSVIVPSTISGTTSATPIPASNISVSIIDSFCFAGSNIQYVRIPDGLKSINFGAFKDCLELKKVYLPEKANDLFLSSSVFENCICLESINIPNGLKRIPDSLCFGCKNMTEVYFPSTIEEIYFNAFGDCEKLSDVYFDGTKAEWDSIDIGTGNDYLLKARIHFNGTQEEQPTTEPTTQPSGNEFLYYNNNDGTCGVYDYIGNNENVIIPEKIDNLTVTEIAEGTFNNVDYADSNSISDDKIKTIYISKNVATIKNTAFKGCTNLENFYVDKENPYYTVNNGVLFNFTQTELVNYPYGKTQESFTLPESVNTIRPWSFGYSRLKFITVDKNLKNIGEGAFYLTKSLEQINYLGSFNDWMLINVDESNDYWINAKLSINNRNVIDKWSPYSLKDTWNFENLSDSIPVEVYKSVTHDYMTLLTLVSDLTGVDGQCYGMAASAIGIKNENLNIPGLNKDQGLLNSKINIQDKIEEYDNITISNFIKTLFLSQMYPEMANEKEKNKTIGVKNQNKLNNLFNAVKNQEKGKGSPVQISIGDEEFGSHALMATRLEETSSFNRVYVYDCNHPKSDNRFITFYKNSNGEISSWDFVAFTTSNGEDISVKSSNKDAYISFNNKTYQLMDIVFKKHKILEDEEYQLISTNSDSFSVNGVSNNSNKTDDDIVKCDIDSLLFDKDGVIKNKRENSLYWYTSDNDLTISSAQNAKFKIAGDGGIEFDYLANDSATISFVNGEKVLNYSSENGINGLSVKLQDEDYNIDLKCSSEDDIVIKANGGNPIISGASEIEVNINDNKKKFFLDEDTEYIIKNDTYFYNLKEYYDENTGDINWNYDNGNNTLTISGNGNMSNYYRDYSAPWDEYKNTTKSIVVEDGVVSVGSYAFAGFSKVENVVIADSVKNIGSFAFSRCNSVKYLKAPCSAQWIDKNNVDYDGLNNIETLTFTKGSGKMRNFDTYGSPICESRETLKKLTIEEGVKKIGSYVCFNCENLEEVNLPKSLTKSSDYAFSGCKNIKTVNYAGSLFEWCSINFAQIFGNPAYFAESLCIDGAKLEGKLVIPEGIIKLQSSTFENRDNISSVVFPKSLKTIGMGAFSDCDGLKEVVLSDNVEVIEKWAFEECDNLELFQANNKLKQIGENAFYECVNMKKVVIPDIEKWCNIDFESNPLDASYYTVDLYENDTIIKDLKIPDSISVIKKSAFSNSSIEHLYFGNNVELVQEYAFSHCKRLNTIVMMNSLTTIEKNSFIDCSNLSDVYYSGNEQEWDELAKDLKTNYAFPWEDNLVLANVHYNYNGSPINEPSYPTEPYIEDPSETNEIPPVTEPLEIPTVQPTTDESQIPSSLPSTDEPSNVPITDPTEATTEKPNTTLPTESSEPVVEPTEPATKATSPLVTPKFKKRNNPIKVIVKTKSVKKKKLKSKKQTVKPLSITKAQGKYTVSLVKSGTTKKIRSKILVNKKGVITFKKGKYKKGKYKVKLKIYVKGNAYYRSKTVTKAVKIKIK